MLCPIARKNVHRGMGYPVSSKGFGPLVPGDDEPVLFADDRLDDPEAADHRYDFVGEQLPAHVTVKNLIPFGTLADDDRIGHANLFKQRRHLSHLLRGVEANVVGIG
jgi:hypothetical protein